MLIDPMLQQEVDPQQEQELQELMPLEAPVSGIAIASPRETTWRSAKSPRSPTFRSNELKSSVPIACAVIFLYLFGLN
jgi:hypothetical protein